MMTHHDPQPFSWASSHTWMALVIRLICLNFSLKGHNKIGPNKVLVPNDVSGRLKVLKSYLLP